MDNNLNQKLSNKNYSKFKTNENNGYFPSNMKLVDRSNVSNMFAEQLAINEVNLLQIKKSKSKNTEIKQLSEQKVFRVDPNNGIISKKEYILTNGGVFNKLYIENDNNSESDKQKDFLIK